MAGKHATLLRFLSFIACLQHAPSFEWLTGDGLICVPSSGELLILESVGVRVGSESMRHCLASMMGSGCLNLQVKVATESPSGGWAHTSVVDDWMVVPLCLYSGSSALRSSALTNITLRTGTCLVMMPPTPDIVAEDIQLRALFAPTAVDGQAKFNLLSSNESHVATTSPSRQLAYQRYLSCESDEQGFWKRIKASFWEAWDGRTLRCAKISVSTFDAIVNTLLFAFSKDEVIYLHRSLKNMPSYLAYDAQEAIPSDMCYIGYLQSVFVLYKCMTAGHYEISVPPRAEWTHSLQGWFSWLLYDSPVADGTGFVQALRMPLYVFDDVGWPPLLYEMTGLRHVISGGRNFKLTSPAVPEHGEIDDRQPIATFRASLRFGLVSLHGCAADAYLTLKTALPEAKLTGAWYGFSIFCEKAANCAEALCNLDGAPAGEAFCRASKIDDVMHNLVRGHSFGVGESNAAFSIVEFSSILGAFADESLTDKDLVVCYYPSVVCAFLDEVVSAPMLVGLDNNPFLLTDPVVGPLVAAKYQALSSKRNRGVFTLSWLFTKLVRRWLGIELEKWHVSARHVINLLPETAMERWMEGNLRSAVSSVLVSRLSMCMGLPEAGVMETVLQQITATSGLRLSFITNRRFEYRALVEYDAVVVFPWNWAVSFFKEVYALSLPLYVPALKYIPSILMTGTSQDRWVDIPVHEELSFLAGKRLGLSNSSSPDRLQSILQWLPHTDYSRYPFVQLFEGLADLTSQMLRLDRRVLIGNMRAVNLRESTRTLKLARAMLARMGLSA